ncbi:MAG: IMP cyclohydrolase [Spirochaetaceae bacterium]|jgi:phosphoribosylaminoimidazolecarboxamide formyltransferase/IMP cyclohydrolase|nr:IMP cyclohydrolase [Spirochaetaceae bacterium]
MADLKKSYSTILEDSFTPQMEISFIDEGKKQTLIYEKVNWDIDGEKKGLRYGENPGQPAALYRPINGNILLGEVKMLETGNFLASDIELVQSGKHPGKTNIADADAALNIMKYFSSSPCCVIIKHNNPCGVAKSDSNESAYGKALLADRIAAFGGAVAFNRTVDAKTAEKIIENYHEVIIAPDFEEKALELFRTKKNLRVMKIENIKRLESFIGEPVLDFKSMMDGGVIVQWSYIPETLKKEDFLKAETTKKGEIYSINREPTDAEYEDMLFGWLVEAGVTSNSVLYVKDGVTVAIGTGEQDRVGVATIARDKAYRNMKDRISWTKYHTPWTSMTDLELIKEIENEVEKVNGGLKGSVMISDAFFPFRDGIDVGLKEGVTAVVQPGGSINDFECINACNEFKAAMVFTGQRSFKH